MGISIHTGAPAVGRTSATSASSFERGAMRDLAKALRTDDLEAARRAYAEVIRNAPSAMQFPRASPFADLGRALAQGDLKAAQDAFRAMGRGRLDGGAGVPLPPSPLPPQPLDAMGTLVDLVA